MNRTKTTPAKGCPSHKRRFVDFAQAVAAAVRVSRHLGPLRCYQCPDCNGWHLTRRHDWQARP